MLIARSTSLHHPFAQIAELVIYQNELLPLGLERE